MRRIKASKRFGFENLIAYALMTVMKYNEESEPLSNTEAINSKDSQKWFTAMVEEFESLQKNRMWKLVENQQIKRRSCVDGSLRKRKELTTRNQLGLKPN